jgi:hypothetical protein
MQYYRVVGYADANMEILFSEKCRASEVDQVVEDQYAAGAVHVNVFEEQPK